MRKHLFLLTLVAIGAWWSVAHGPFYSFEQKSEKNSVTKKVSYKLEEGVKGGEMTYSVERNKQKNIISVTLVDKETGDTIATKTIKDPGGKLTSHILE